MIPLWRLRRAPLLGFLLLCLSLPETTTTTATIIGRRALRLAGQRLGFVGSGVRPIRPQMERGGALKLWAVSTVARPEHGLGTDDHDLRTWPGVLRIDQRPAAAGLAAHAAAVVTEGSRLYDFDAFDDTGAADSKGYEDESYETMWKQRRVEELMAMPELSVDTITDLFAPDQLDRHREMLDPIEGYGAIFQLDGVVLDMTDLDIVFWRIVANEFGLRTPSREEVMQAGSMKPDMAASRCFGWTWDLKEASKYALVYSQVQQRIMARITATNMTQLRPLAGGAGGNPTRTSERETTVELLLTDEAGDGGFELDVSSLTVSAVDEGGFASSRGLKEGATLVRYMGQTVSQPQDIDAIENSLPEDPVVVSMLFSQKELVQRPLSRWSQEFDDDANRAAAAAALAQVRVRQGFESWVAQLRERQVPCAVVSSYPFLTVRAALEASGLWEPYFASANGDSPGVLRGDGRMGLVSADDGYDREAQAYLGAALRMSRPPQKCVVFGSSPSGIMGAHEADMRAIAVLSGSPHKAYEMRIADLTIQEFDEMSLMNLRGVFADRQYPWQIEPQLQLEPETQPKRKKTQSRWIDG